MPTTIKHGDATTLTWDLGVDLPGANYTAARVVIGEPGQPPRVDRAGSIDGSRVSVTLGPSDLPVGVWAVEVEMSPGPHTYPSEGHELVVVDADLG